MNVGIVGHEKAKFTALGEQRARALINELLKDEDILVSGHCHLGGVDIWAEQEARKRSLPQPLIFPPRQLNWLNGYRPRNVQIATNSEIVHVLVVATYPEGYTGMQFSYCYHCVRDTAIPGHVKSGGCWTAKYARGMGKLAEWHVIENY